MKEQLLVLILFLTSSLSIAQIEMTLEEDYAPISETVQIDEIGILYDSSISQILVDTIFKKGTYLMPTNSSLIKYNLRTKRVNLNTEAFTKYKENIQVKLNYVYCIKSDSVHTIQAEIGKEMIQPVVNAILRSTIREYIGNYTSKEIYLLDKDVISDQIRKEIKNMQYLRLFIFDFITFEKIEFPHIISKANEDDLLLTYELLNNSDSKKRLVAIKQLFAKSSKTSILLILDHWSKERNQENLDYILNQMTIRK